MVGFEFGFRILAHHDAVLLVGVDFSLPHFDAPSWKNWGCWPKPPGLKPVARITCKRKAPDAALVHRQWQSG